MLVKWFYIKNTAYAATHQTRVNRMHIEDAIEQLAKAERFSFRDWPNKSIPRVTAGVT
jgi:hypothetical protein